MALISTNAYGDLDLWGYDYPWMLDNGAANFSFTFSTDKGNYTFVPDDFIAKGVTSKTKQYYSTSLLSKDTLNTLYTKYQPLDFGDFKGFYGADTFYQALKDSGFGTSGILIPEKDFQTTVKGFKNYNLNLAVGNVTVGAIQGIGEKDGNLVYIPQASGADQSVAWIQSSGTINSQWQPELKWYQRLAKEIAKVPLFPEIAALATAAIPGGQAYAPYVYAALKGAALGAQGVDPLKAGLMVGINLAAQNLAGNTVVAKNIGSAIGVTNEALQIAAGKAVIGATVNGVKAAVTGGDVTQAMLDGALTAGASSAVPEISKNILGPKSKEFIDKIAKETNLTSAQVQTIVATSFVSGISAQIKGEDFAKTFANSLVGAGVSQSVANEVGKQVGDTVTPEMREAIVTGTSTVAKTAATAALNNKDIAKELEANLPATIVATMSTYQERKKNEETAVKEGWANYDQKVAAVAKWGAGTTPIDAKSKDQFVKDAEEFTFRGEGYDTRDQAAEAARREGYNTFKWHDGKIYTLGGQSLTSMDTFVQAMNPNFDPVAYKRVNNLGSEINAAEHYLDVGQYKSLPVSYEQYVDKTFSALPEYQPTSAKDFYKEERDAAIAAAKAGDFSRVDEIAKYIDKTFTTADEARTYLKDAYRLAGEDREPTEQELKLVRGQNEVNAYTIAQAVSAMGVTTFDGSKFATPKLAEDAAKKAGYNTFTANDGNTYKVTSTLDEANIRANVEEQKTFRDAFAMARAQLGDGKSFTWNGKQYTTNVLPADTFDASRTGSIEAAATVAYANGKTKFIASDGRVYNIPPEARAALENAVNQSPAETARLLRQAVTPEQNEYMAETQRLMEKPGRSTMDNISAMTSQLLGTTQRGIANLMTSAGKTYAAVTGDLSFDNALTRFGQDLENYAKQSDVYGLDVQKNRLKQALDFANQLGPERVVERTDEFGNTVSVVERPEKSFYEKTKIIGAAIRANPIGFFDIAGSEAIEELPETAVQIAIALGTGGGGMLGIAAVSAGGSFLESFGNSAEETYKLAKARGDSDEVATNKAYLSATVNTLLEIGPEIVADRALVAPFMKNIGNSLVGATGQFVGSTAVGAASEFVSGFSQSLATQYVVDPKNFSVGKAVTDGIYESFIGGTVQGALSLPGYAIQAGTIIGKDYNGNDVTINDLINNTKVLNSSTVDPNIVIGRTESNNEITLGGAMSMMPSYQFDQNILTTYAPKVFANQDLVVGRDELGNNVTIGQIRQQVTPDKTYSDVYSTIVNPSVETKINAQKNFLDSQLRAIGFSPSSEQVDKLIVPNPQGSQSLVNTAKTFAFQETAKEENYPLTTTETERLLRSGSNIQTVSQFREYVDPRSVTAQEAREFLAEQGYTKPTETEILQLTRGNLPTKEDADIALQVAVGRKPFDPKYDWNGDGKVTAGDALNILKASQGRTDVDLPAFETGWMPSEALSRVRATEIADPYVFDAGEIQAIAASEGFAITPEEAKALAREETEVEAARRYRQEVDPLAVIQSEAQQFFESFGYMPEPDELTQFILSKPESEVRPLVGEYVDPRQMTQQEAEAIFGKAGYKLATDEVSPFVRSGKNIQQALVEQDIQKYIDENTVTVPEVILAYRALGIDAPAPEDVTRHVGQMKEVDVLKDIEETADRARYNALQHKMSTQAAQAAQRSLGQRAMELVTPAAALAGADQGPKFLEPFITSTMKQEPFVGSLQPFLEEVAETDYTKGAEFEPEMQSTQEVAENTQQGETVMPSYFTYGNPSDIDKLFAPVTTTGTSFFKMDPFSTEELTAARGGLVPPLMAMGGLSGGGLPVVAHSGKARIDFRQGAAVSGPGDGQSDDIPAMLADGEFVFPADVVAALGNGSTKAGSKKLYDMMHSIRAHHRSAKPKDLPPPAKKSPLDYLKKARR